MRAGSDINAQNIVGDAPLHKAALNGRVLAAGYLIRAGADVNVRYTINIYINIYLVYIYINIERVGWVGGLSSHLFWTSDLWTHQPGSHKRKITQDFSSTFLLRCFP